MNQTGKNHSAKKQEKVSRQITQEQEKSQKQNKKAKQKKKNNKPADIDSKKIRNKETNIISFIFVGLFVMLTGYLVYYNIYVGPNVINNPYNKRIDNMSERIVRGDILSSDKTVLASTSIADDGTETRVYPYGSIFSHVIGIDNSSRTGIEKIGNFYLLSADDNLVQQIYSDVSGQKRRGDNVVTTLDVKLQKAASDALGNNKGAVVVMEPSTGKVLAMVSKPDYDPNLASSMMSEWLTYDTNDSVLLNRATQGLYPPGSTFKILTALEYIKENNAIYNEYSYECNGSIAVGDSFKIRCFNGTVHGTQNLENAFAHSCNSTFASIGSNIDISKYRLLCEEFLFNRNLPLDIEHSNSSFSLVSGSSTGEIMQTAIGQGKTLITPMHNLMIASAVANDGLMMKPYFIDKIETSSGSVVKQYKPSAIGNVCTTDEANVLTQYMKSVVEYGTGRNLRGASYEPAGKTGTAEYSDDSDDAHSWFIGFAPSDNPQVAISVILEGGYSNVSSAQEVARKVLDIYYNK